MDAAAKIGEEEDATPGPAPGTLPMRRAFFAFAIGLFAALGTVAGVLFVLWHLPAWTFDAIRAAWKRAR